MACSRLPVLLLLLLATGLCACASRPAPLDAEGWTDDQVVSYRLLSKDDFQSATSNSLWGNVAHGAEICTVILPVEDAKPPAFHAVMRPDCSFWNKVIGPVGFLTRLAGLATGVPTVTPVKQPDWYILQHEQVHFAINHAAALRLSRKLAEREPRTLSVGATRRLWEIAQRHAAERHRRFDQETSGRYDTYLLEKWVRALQSEFGELCEGDADCRVRNRGS